MAGKVVALVKEKNRRENILKALILISKDLTPFRQAKRVLIKPNFTSAYNPVASTQAETVEAILEFFEGFDRNFWKKEIVIAESSGEAYSRGEKMDKVFKRFGFGKIFAKYKNVKFWEMSRAKSFVSVSIETLSGRTKVRIPKEFFNFDYKISVSIPKTHDTVIFTAGVKNFLMGIIKQEDKGLMHGLVGKKKKKSLTTKILSRVAWLVLKKSPWRVLLLGNIYLPNWLKDKIYGFNRGDFIRSVVCLHKNLVKVGKLIMPDLVVLDGWRGMEVDGPVYGRPKKLEVAIASGDPIAADAVGAKVIGFKVEKIAYLHLLAKVGKGNLYPKNLVGEKVDKVSQKFQPHRHYKYQLEGSLKLLKDF